MNRARNVLPHRPPSLFLDWRQVALVTVVFVLLGWFLAAMGGVL